MNRKLFDWFWFVDILHENCVAVDRVREAKTGNRDIIHFFSITNCEFWLEVQDTYTFSVQII